MTSQFQTRPTIEKIEVDFSFITPNMTIEQQVAAYREHYTSLYEHGVLLVEDLQNQIKQLKEAVQQYEKQEQFGIIVIEHLRSQLGYFYNQYPDDPNSINKNNQGILKQYEEMKSNNHGLKPSENWKQKYVNERRQSQFLQKKNDLLSSQLEKTKVEMENSKTQLQTDHAKAIDNVNNLWTNQLLGVFQQVEQKGIDISEIQIPTVSQTDEESKTAKTTENNENKKRSESDSIQNLRKNLIRILTKTEWNDNDLNMLHDEMENEFINLNKENINKKTDPFNNITYKSDQNNNDNNRYFQRLYEDLQKQNETTILEYQQRIIEQRNTINEQKIVIDEQTKKLDKNNFECKEMIEEERIKFQIERNIFQTETNNQFEIERKKFEEERKLLIDSKIQLLESTSNEIQHLRDLIRTYNPEYRFKSKGKGDTLFQFIHDSSLTEIEFQKR